MFINVILRGCDKGLTVLFIILCFSPKSLAVSSATEVEKTHKKANVLKPYRTHTIKPKIGVQLLLDIITDIFFVNKKWCLCFFFIWNYSSAPGCAKNSQSASKNWRVKVIKRQSLRTSPSLRCRSWMAVSTLFAKWIKWIWSELT